MDAAFEYAKFAAETTYSQLPAEVVELIKKDVLDTLGNILAGSADPDVEKLLGVVRAEKSCGSSTVAVFGDRLPARQAALVNGMMGFSLDYDDISEPATMHMGVALISAALAVAQQEAPVTGEELICAIAVGMEIVSRLGRYMVRRTPGQIMGGWDYAALLSYFSAAVAAAKLMKLPREQIHNAMGIAYHQASGTSLSAMEHASTKLLGPGFAAQGGVLSAQLAAAGLTGAKSVFDATDISLAKQYNSGCDSEALVRGLGTTWELLGLGFKAYPCCRQLHRQIDAALELVRRYQITAGEVVKVRVEVSPMLLPLIAQKPDNYAPPTKLISQFSIPWTVACAIGRGRVDIGAFEEDARRDKALQDIARLVEGYPNPELTNIDIPSDFQIETTRGVFKTRTGDPYGAPENPIPYEALQEKFYDCAAYAKRQLPADALQSIVNMVETLEKTDDAAKLASLLN